MRNQHRRLVGLERRLRALRVERNYTQAEAAKRIGVGSESLRKFEAGESTPTLCTLLWVCDAYKVTLLELLPEES